MVNNLDEKPLPTPVEVIAINSKSSSNLSGSIPEGPQRNQSLNPFLTGELTNPLELSAVESAVAIGQTTKVSSNSFGKLCGIHNEENEVGRPLLAANSENELLKRSTYKDDPSCKKKKDDIVNMDLVDTTFSPYKKKSGSTGHLLNENGQEVDEDLPKIKISLPKKVDDSDDGESSVSSDGEGPLTKPLDN